MAMLILTANARASGVLTVAGGNIADADTVTVGGKVYTFQTSLTNTDGHVLIGASNATALANLASALTLGAVGGGVAGTNFATATTANTYTSFGKCAFTATTLTAYAHEASGAAGNLVTSTSTAAHATWGGTTFAGGAQATTAPSTALNTVLNTMQVNAKVGQYLTDLVTDLTT